MAGWTALQQGSPLGAQREAVILARRELRDCIQLPHVWRPLECRLAVCRWGPPAP